MFEAVFCCFTHRCLLNYEPLLHKIQQEGGCVSLAIFPRLCDPDHVKLLEPNFPVRCSYPIDREGELIHGSLEEICVAIGSPDLLMFGTCNLGPERVIGGMVPARRIIGLQHGFYQDWQDYSTNPTLPAIGVFGTGFQTRLDKPSLVLGLPKLDLVQRLPGNPDGDIIYAAQYSNDIDKLSFALERLEHLSGKQVHVRPHPEGREHLKSLRSRFSFLDPEEPLELCFRRAAVIVTTGSTIVLEALVANIPVVVLPDCHGHEYEPAGIVAPDIAAEAILDIWRCHEDRAASTHDFLQVYTGSATSNRTCKAYRSLVHWLN